MSENSFPQRVTLRDIAQALGVSHVTVSRALHDHPEIPLARRQQIQAEARRMGYQPNAMAVALGRQRHFSGIKPISAEIAWINYWSDPAELRRFRELDLYWQGAVAMAEQCGYRLAEFGPGGMSPRRLVQVLSARGIQGVLIPPHRFKDFPAGWARISWNDFNIVRFGRSVLHPPSHLVAGDHLGIGSLAWENIRRLGYRRIGYVSSAETTSRAYGGFLMGQLELPAEERLAPVFLPVDANHSIEVGAFLAWFEENRPDAIFSDVAALRGVLEAAGYRVPEDVAMATTSVLDGGVDAGIVQNSEKIGRAAVEMVISLIQHREAGAPRIRRELLIESSWRDGASMPPRGAGNAGSPRRRRAEGR